ncbi:MAG TPA: MATE family efflux transporter [Cyclobacteriaceae bacterium]|nr:MATE family efflux transporter [Cyclobacteriaceae bacterium]
MTTSEHIKENWKLAAPVMISQLGHVMMGVMDNIMVGHVSSESLAAAGLALVAFNVLFLFGIGVSFAITPLVAAALGEQDDAKIINVLRHGLVVNLLNGILLFVIARVGENVLYHLEQPPEVVALAIPYLNIVAFSLIPILVFQSFKQFAEGLSQTRVAMTVILSANVLNLILNYLFIYGHGGFPAMGLTGAGWATLTSRTFMMVAIAGYVYYAPFFGKYRLGFSIGNYSKRLFRQLLALGIPSGVQFIFEVAAFDFSLIMMGWLGTEVQAAHMIAINLATISYMTTSGLAAAATVRVGYFFGSKDHINLRVAARTLLLMALSIMACWTLIFILGRQVLPVVYVDDVEVINIASTLLVIAGLFQLADGTQVVCASALRGLQDVRVPSLLIFFAYWVVGLPLGYWLGFGMDLGGIGIWLGLLIGLTITASALYIRFQRMSRLLSSSTSPI